MRTKLITMALAACIAAPAIAAAQSGNPCAERTCAVVLDWGNGAAPPDVDRRFGAPSDLESTFLSVLTGAGWKIGASTAAAPLTITMRISPKNRALCEAMPGVNPDYSCHTVQRAAIVFTANDSSVKSISRVDVNPNCSDPKASPSFAQFGRYAAEMVVYVVANDSKGQRPGVKCL